jgi:hypothetical protein
MEAWNSASLSEKDRARSRKHPHRPLLATEIERKCLLKLKHQPDLLSPMSHINVRQENKMDNGNLADLHEKTFGAVPTALRETAVATIL